MSNEMGAGRWTIGDIAERKSDGILFKVIGIISEPAIVFHAIDGEDQMVHVAGSRNELEQLVRFQREDTDEKA